MSKIITTMFITLFVLPIVACVSVRQSDTQTQSVPPQQELSKQPPNIIAVVNNMEKINMEEVNMSLLDAASSGDVETVKTRLEQGADVHTANKNGVTPLIAAAYQNHIEVAQVLISAGADVNVQDNTQQSAYLISTSDGFLELLQLTLANGADVHSLDSYNGTGLIRAADRGHVAIIEELLKTAIDIDHVNRLNWTALLEAIILGDGGSRHTEVVRLLVDAGVDISLPDGNGVTALEHARQRGYDEIATILESVHQQ